MLPEVEVATTSLVADGSVVGLDQDGRPIAAPPESPSAVLADADSTASAESGKSRTTAVIVGAGVAAAVFGAGFFLVSRRGREDADLPPEPPVDGGFRG